MFYLFRQQKSHSKVRPLPLNKSRSRALLVETLEDRSLMARVLLDPTFSGDGVLTTNVTLNHADVANAVAVLPTGAILVAGDTDASTTAVPNNLDFALRKYSATGEPDTSFGGSGTARRDFKIGSKSAYDVPTVLLPLSNGNILVAGSVDENRIGLARFSATGQLDTTFGATTFDTGDFVRLRGMVSQAGGKIIVAGALGGSIKSKMDFIVARFDASGKIDTTFGSNGNGKVVASFGSVDGDDEAFGVTIASDGTIYAVGTTIQSDGRHAAALHLTANGAPLASSKDGFDSLGRHIDSKVVPAVAGFTGNGLSYLSDGKIYSTGRTSSGAFAFTRGLTDGSVDPDFNPPSHIVSQTFGSSSEAHAMIRQSDGKLIVVGAGANIVSGIADFAVARYGIAPTISSFSVPTQVVEQHSVTLSADAFVQNVGEAPGSYSWFVSGPAGFHVSSAANSFSFTPPVAGTYTAQLTVRDAVGVKTSKTQTIKVIPDVPRIARFVTPATAKEGDILVFSAVAFQAGTTTEVPNYHWTLTGPFYSATFETAKVRVKAIDDGPFTLRLDVTDQNGKTSSKTATIAISNVPPVITAFNVPASAKIGHQVALSATATDIAGTRDTIKFSWLITGPGATRKTLAGAAPTWTPVIMGTYTVKLTVFDEDFGVTTATKTISVTF